MHYSADVYTLSPSEFPLTSWPGTPIPKPRVMKPAFDLDEAGYLRLEDIHQGRWVERRPLLDGPREPGARGGVLPDEFVLWELLELGDRLRRAGLSFEGTATFDLKFEIPPKAVELIRAFWTKWGAITISPHPQIAPGFRIADRTHLNDVVFRLLLAESMSRHWIAFIKGDYYSSAWAWQGFASSRPTPGDPGERISWWWVFTRAINDGLAEIPPHLVYWPDEAWRRIEPEPVTVYAACCAQIYNLANDAFDQVPLRQCANETCGRYFMRQRDGAAQGQSHTKGVKYCSKNCRYAQGQRERRRRHPDEPQDDSGTP